MKNHIRVMYRAGDLFLSVATGRTEYVAGDSTQSNAHAAYDFGFAKLVGTYSRDKAGATTGRGGSVGAIFPVGAGELKVAYSQYRTTAGAVTQAPRKFAIGYVHNLSKRTALYGTVARVQNRGGSNVALNGSTTGANQSSTGFDLGFRHTF